MAIVGAIAVPHPPLIVPAVGRGDEVRIQATIDAYRQATEWLLGQQPDCLVVASPHAPLYRDAFHVTTDQALDGDMAQFRAPQARLHAQCDVELAQAIVQQASAANIMAVGSDHYRDDMDHGTFVPLHFVSEAAGCAPGALPCPIVRMGLSWLSPQMHREFGHAIARAADSLGRRVGFIASGDLSHKLLPEGPYGFAPEGPVFDERIGEIFSVGNLDELFGFEEAFCEAAAECGLRSFQIMTGALDGLAYETEMLSNEGPFGVGYGVAVCKLSRAACEQHRDFDDSCAAEEARLRSSTFAPVALARLSVETYVRTGYPAVLPASTLADLIDRRAGVFVSLHKHGELRGCIGTIGPVTSSIAEEVLRNGIAACSEDPRFPPVREDELDYLEYSVDVLGDPEPVSTIDVLDSKRYGVIVTKGWKRGLLLPNLDGVDSVEEQLRIAKMKAGIDPVDTKVKLERFEVVRYTAGGEPRVSEAHACAFARALPS